MERSINNQLDEVLHLSRVTGIICIDNSGFCLGAKGNIPEQCCGSLSALASQAAMLSQNISSAGPVIFLESELGSVLVKKTNQLTTAIFKSS